MKGLFHYDGYLNKILTKIMYIVAVNLLFIIASVPLVTIGASWTAMHTVLFQFLQNDEPDILKTFFKSFRENLKKASCIWIGMLAVAATLVFNYYALYHMAGAWTEIVRIFFNFILLFWGVLWIYVFPAIAYYQNSILGYLQFSIRVALAHLPVTVVILILQTVPVLFVLFLAQYLPMAVLLLVCCGFSLPSYGAACFLLKLFKRYEEKFSNEEHNYL